MQVYLRKIKMMYGKFFGIGVGPGDPKMLTLRGLEVLKKVDVICTPISKSGRDSLAIKVVEDLVVGKEIVNLIFPMTKDEEILNYHWKEARKKIMTYLKKGCDVAFLTIGDPTFYSTYLHLLDELRNYDLKIETIPGVTSISACLSALNLPLAKGNDKIAILPASEAHGNLKHLLEEFECIILMKATRLRDIAKELEYINMEQYATVFTKCGRQKFASYPLVNLDKNRLDYFSMVYIRRNE